MGTGYSDRGYRRKPCHVVTVNLIEKKVISVERAGWYDMSEGMHEIQWNQMEWDGMKRNEAHEMITTRKWRNRTGYMKKWRKTQKEATANETRWDELNWDKMKENEVTWNKIRDNKETQAKRTETQGNTGWHETKWHDMNGKEMKWMRWDEMKWKEEGKEKGKKEIEGNELKGT
jgi:hypothetical protein